MPNLSGLSTGLAVRGTQRGFRAYIQNGRDRMRKYDGENWRNAGIQPWRSAIVSTSLTTNVVTVTTASAHLLTTSSTVVIYVENNGAVYNGQYAVASTPTATTFTYARTATNIASAANGGTATLVPTVATQGTGLTGRYRYIVVPQNRAHRVYGNRVVAALPTAISAEISLANQGCRISGIPATHPDAQVESWALYRNKANRYDGTIEDEAQDFWKVAEIALGTTTYDDATGTDTVAALDDALSPETVDFFTNIPPTCKFWSVFGDRMFVAGFDALTTGTATVNATTTLIDFSGVTIPDGVAGCFFQKQGDDKIYTIAERVSTTQIALENAFVGSLSGASYTIFRDPSKLYFSEFNDFDAWGRDGEYFRNNLSIGSPRRKITGLAALNNSLYVFKIDQIYRVYGKGVDQGDVKVQPDPFYDGLGAVSGDAIVTIDNECYFLSLQGPCVFDGSGAPQRIGEELGTDWLSSLNPAQLSIAAAGTDGRYVWFSVPKTSQTENGLTYRFDRYTRMWWQEDYTHPAFYLYDLDSSGNPASFYAQGKFIFQQNSGTSDGVPSGTTSGTITSATTTSITDSGASFYTTGSGLEERYVHIFAADSGGLPGALVGSRRITSNTATALTWSASGAGGGTLSVPASAKYYVGPVYWYWKTKTYQQDTGEHKRALESIVNFELQGEGTASTLVRTEYRNGTALTDLQSVTVDEVSKRHPVNVGNADFAEKFECRIPGNQVAIRSIVPSESPTQGHKQ